MDVLKREAVFLFRIGIFLPVDLAQKHFERTDPQTAVAVELPVCLLYTSDAADE